MTAVFPEYTVARHLACRLAELGITHLFGVPGNHLGPFLTTLRDEGDVEWVGTPTEGGAGQAADAYARVHGIGAAAVTYSVGAFNLLNACGGAYVEHVPLVAINACPPYEQWQNYRALGLLTSHMSPRRESNLDVYRQVTVPAGGFLSQISWLSIGWSVGAATGAALAPGRHHARPMVFVGDGAFQETCQEISTHTRLGLRSVVFVMDNGHFYGIEQMLVHPSYYADRYSRDGTGEAEEADFYNVLHPWHYDRLAEVFSGKDTPANGISIAHTSELDDLLARLADPTDPLNAGPLLVRVRLHRHDYPRAMAYKVQQKRG
ncbi:thiamine pyrophosphate-binding protein [Streptomyces sp. BRA346]|uniref:thiamine pyrophosphate-binding protein n=1 Tax=Streptomyces sp. BRA346 TaxID=2878199 RepID=UPI004063CB94